jgi:hypothetical protein
MSFSIRRVAALTVVATLGTLFLTAGSGSATPTAPAADATSAAVSAPARTDVARILKELTSGAATATVDGKALARPAGMGTLAWSCGSRCDYQDPATFPATYCGQYCYIACGDDAVTIDTAWHGSDYIELRYSNYCQTIWIRGNAYVCCNNVQGAAMSTHPYGNYGTIYGTVYLPAGNGVRYSKMLNDAGRCGRGQIYAAGSAFDWTTCY